MEKITIAFEFTSLRGTEAVNEPSVALFAARDLLSHARAKGDVVKAVLVLKPDTDAEELVDLLESPSTSRPTRRPAPAGERQEQERTERTEHTC